MFFKNCMVQSLTFQIYASGFCVLSICVSHHSLAIVLYELICIWAKASAAQSSRRILNTAILGTLCSHDIPETSGKSSTPEEQNEIHVFLQRRCHGRHGTWPLLGERRWEMVAPHHWTQKSSAAKCHIYVGNPWGPQNTKTTIKSTWAPVLRKLEITLSKVIFFLR